MEASHSLQGPQSPPLLPFPALLSLALTGWVGPSAPQLGLGIGGPSPLIRAGLVSCNAGLAQEPLGRAGDRMANQSRLPSHLTTPQTGPRQAPQGETKSQHCHLGHVRVGRPPRCPVMGVCKAGEWAWRTSLRQLQLPETPVPTRSLWLSHPQAVLNRALEAWALSPTSDQRLIPGAALRGACSPLGRTPGIFVQSLDTK